MLPNFTTLLTRPIQLLALGFGSGLAPKAPGTFGTLAALPFFFVFLWLPLWAYCLLLLFSFFMGIYLCEKTANDFGVHDHPAIVWDEFVGLWLTLLPLLIVGVSSLGVVLGFIFFRFFDIVKPWPISYLDQQVHGGLGIMIDDVIAGVFAALLLFVSLHLYSLAVV